MFSNHGSSGSMVKRMLGDVGKAQKHGF